MTYSKSESSRKPKRDSEGEGLDASTDTPKRNKRNDDELKEIIAKRNYRLEKLFKALNINVRIIGDPNTPNMILDERFILNAYVHNFELRFVDKPFDGSVIYTVKLTEYPSYDKKQIEDAIYEYSHRIAYKVYLSDSKPRLYLSGYNFTDRTNGTGRYPVFAASGPKIYFTNEKAVDVAAEISQLGYTVSVED
jgi:hypothetical protein